MSVCLSPSLSLTFFLYFLTMALLVLVAREVGETLAVEGEGHLEGVDVLEGVEVLEGEEVLDGESVGCAGLVLGVSLSR